MNNQGEIKKLKKLVRELSLHKNAEGRYFGIIIINSSWKLYSNSYLTESALIKSTKKITDKLGIKLEEQGIYRESKRKILL